MKEHKLDAAIIGAGISGINAAYDLQKKFPDMKIALYEARSSLGGTWDLFRYPGIRSDTDMYSLGYRFKPWASSKSIGNGEDILSYLSAAAKDNGILQKIHFDHKVATANWCSKNSQWELTVKNLNNGKSEVVRSKYLFACNGYYSYSEGYRPDFPNEEAFSGEFIHPQFWRNDLQYAGKKVVIIGSGATAITLAPAMANHGAKVTILQRSPTYIVSQPQKSVVVPLLSRLTSESIAHSAMRLTSVLKQTLFYMSSKSFPSIVRRLLIHRVRRNLGPDYPVDKHFTPSYQPWDQRVCVVPDGDLFAAIKAGLVEMVTDKIRSFDDTGIELESGGRIDADIVVTATGLKMELLSGMDLRVDGNEVCISERYLYKGAMLEGVPNAFFYIGYPNASWTLKTDLLGDFACRVIQRMSKSSYDTCVPMQPSKSLSPAPLLNLSSGYILRAKNTTPKSSTDRPWKTSQNYFRDFVDLKIKRVDDGHLKFLRGSISSEATINSTTLSG